MRLSPDGRTLAWLDGLGVTLWDVTGKTPRRRAWLHGQEQVYDVAFAPAGKTLLCATAQSGLAAWDVSGPESQRRSVPAVEAGATSVCFRPDGRQFAWADRRGEVVLWDLATSAAARRWRLPGIVDRVFMTADARHLLMHNSNGTVYVVRLAPPA
jgi:WD40 repeat protein